MGRPPRRGQPLNKGQDGGSERVRYSEVSLYFHESHAVFLMDFSSQPQQFDVYLIGELCIFDYEIS